MLGWQVTTFWQSHRFKDTTLQSRRHARIWARGVFFVARGDKLYTILGGCSFISKHRVTINKIYIFMLQLLEKYFICILYTKKKMYLIEEKFVMKDRLKYFVPERKMSKYRLSRRLNSKVHTGKVPVFQRPYLTPT